MRPFVPRGDRPGGVGNVAKGGANNDAQDRAVHAYRDTCGKCGARRIDSQLGLEPTPEQYVANMVAVFREVRRVLRDDGTLWLNLGDSYAANRTYQVTDNKHRDVGNNGAMSVPPGLKPKDLVGIPWMVAFALRADGWYLRSDIIWAKPNPMPESVTDRPTKAHEYLFLLTKGPRYFYDADAIRDEWADKRNGNSGAVALAYSEGSGRNDTLATDGKQGLGAEPATPGRNKRSVWTVTTQPFPDAHFATFPPKLIEPCILAGSPPKCCGECGAPWERVVVATAPDGRSAEVRGGKAYDEDGTPLMGDNMIDHGVRGSWNSGGATLTRETAGWRSTCDHDDDSGTATVLDPFNGAGTTGVVALRHNRDFIGIELNETYAEMARRRIYDDAPLFNHESATLGALQPVRPEAALERVRKAWAAEECDRLDASADRRSSVPRSTENAPATQRRPGAEPRGVSS